MKNNKVFDQITDRIIEGLETAGKWSKPWGSIGDSSAPHNPTTGTAYTGINWLVLNVEADRFSCNQWMTYKQAASAGGNVKKGEKGTQIIFFKMLKKEDKRAGTTETFPMLKTYTVFNFDQCENVTREFPTYTPPVIPENGAKALADAIGAKVQYGGDRACFIPSIDVIKMPLADSFKTWAHHEATLLHELTHWTGHSDRLDRLKNGGFGSTTYAFEELVAELGSAMAGSVLGVPYEGLQHVEYIASWLKSLKSDPKYIYQAAKYASRAVNFILSELEQSGSDVVSITAAA